MLRAPLGAALLSALLLSGWGCAPSEPAKAPVTLGDRVAPSHVSEQEFASALHAVLKDGAMNEPREALLLGVVKRQLVHARGKFDAGADARGMASVLGAVYLMRAGEESASIVDRDTRPALEATSKRLSARGDIGRAQVLLELLRATGSEAERREIDPHLAAIERFRSETLTGRPMERAGDSQRTSFGKALLSPAHVDEAVTAASSWIDLAIQHNITFQQTGRRPHQAEIPEIARALESGALSVVALLLRYGKIGPTMDKLTGSSAKRIADPLFFGFLADAEKLDSAESYRELYDALGRETNEKVGGDYGIDPELYEAARFAVALEAYRRDPSHLPTALALTQALTSFGMSEVVPLVLAEATSERTSQADLVRTVRAVESAVSADASAGDAAAAIRTIEAAPAFVTRVAALAKQGGASEALAELRYAMASVLIEAGAHDGGAQLLSAALADLPRASGLLLRSELMRRGGRTEEALSDLAKVSALKGAQASELGEAKLLSFELLRDAGKTDAARAALEEALGLLTKDLGEKRARAERVATLTTLGRVLTAFGDKDAARRAFHRALEQVRGDPKRASLVLLTAAASAFVLNDVDGLRIAIKLGGEAGARAEDLVYCALWLSVAPRSPGSKLDEDAKDILEGASEQKGWLGQLATWSRGRLTNDALERGAASTGSKLEARFYLALSARAKGEKMDDTLRQVATSGLIHRPEAQIARQLIAPQTAFALPKTVKLP